LTMLKNPRILRTITLLITICSLTFPAYAKYSGGTGEPNDPYQIATAADLIALGETPEDYDKHFILTADIDLDPNLPGRKVFDKAVIAPASYTDYYPYVEGTPLAGVFDGNGHAISHLTIMGGSYLGLFGQLWYGAEVKDLGVLDVKVVLDVNITDAGFFDLGGLVGYNRGSVTQCYSSGMIIGGDYVGGLVGENEGAVINCYSTCSVAGNYMVGGLLGYNWDGNITDCYSTSTVSGYGYVGGLVGENVGNMINCYSTGAVMGNEAIGGLVGQNGLQGAMPYPGYIDNSYSLASVRGEIFVGGLVGDNRVGDVMQCYSTGTVSGNESVGGLVGLSVWGSVLCSVWDVETSGLSGSTGGVGLTTREMMDPYMLGLNGFADDPNWVLDPGRDYPRLAWEGTLGQIIPEPDINWLTGQGTSEAPYKIDTSDQLILLGKGPILWDKHFVLGANINLDPDLPGRSVFGQALIQVFTGVFDGNDHVISRMTITGASRLGLFGLLESGAEVKDLGVVDVNITSSGGFIGGLVGHNGGGTVKCCYSSGTVSGNWGVGGLGGWNIGAVTQCYSTAAVSGDSTVGGLVGQNLGDVTQCYSTGAVNGGSHVGGLVGRNFGDVTQCYSTGAVNGGSYVGGLVGYEQDGIVTQCYSTGAVSGGGDYVGGLAGGGWSSDMTASFWDTQTSGQITSTGGTGKTTAEMQTAGTFLEAGWDFINETENGTEDIWWILEGQDYPRLWWEAAEP